jgi:hypothetical protein
MAAALPRPSVAAMSSPAIQAKRIEPVSQSTTTSKKEN